MDADAVVLPRGRGDSAVRDPCHALREDEDRECEEDVPLFALHISIFCSIHKLKNDFKEKEILGKIISGKRSF